MPALLKFHGSRGESTEGLSRAGCLIDSRGARSSARVVRARTEATRSTAASRARGALSKLFRESVRRVREEA
jgi:hypothetical protein